MNQVRLLRRREKGSILGMAAISMTAILLAVGLAIDVGHWYLVGGELQNAADASALAAASSLDSTEGGILKAVTLAKDTVNKYEFSGIDATIADANVSFAATLGAFDSGTALDKDAAKLVPATIKFVKVTVPPKSISVFFASVATGSATISLSRSAVAGFSVGLNRFGNIVPLVFVENRPTETSPHYLQSSNCGSTGLQYVRGCQYTIEVLNGNAPPVGGTYMILDLNSARSSSDLRELLGIGSDGYVTSGQAIPRLTLGVTAGQVKQGLNVRFDDFNGGLDPNTFPPDANIREGITHEQYRNSSFFTAPTHTGVWDRRVLVVPIITPDPSQYNAATGIVTPIKFGAFFMTAATDNKNIYVEYMGTPAVIGNGGYDPNGGPGTVDVTTAVLYR